MGATQEFYVVWSRNSHSGAYLSSECRVTFNPTESRSKICVEVESYNIQDCNIHVNYYDNEAAVETQQVRVVLNRSTIFSGNLERVWSDSDVFSFRQLNLFT